MIFTKTEFFPPLSGWGERVQRSVLVSGKRKRGVSPEWACEDSAKGKKDDQEASYKPDYTGGFITDWEVPAEMYTPKKGNKPGTDFIVDWKN